MGSPSLSTVFSSPKHLTLDEFTAFPTIVMLVDETFLILCPYFDSPYRYPLRYGLLPKELFNLEAPHIQTPSLSQPIRPTSMTLFWETSLERAISRFGDIVLYIIWLLPTVN